MNLLMPNGCLLTTALCHTLHWHVHNCIGLLHNHDAYPSGAPAVVTDLEEVVAPRMHLRAGGIPVSSKAVQCSAPCMKRLNQYSRVLLIPATRTIPCVQADYSLLRYLPTWAVHLPICALISLNLQWCNTQHDDVMHITALASGVWRMLRVHTVRSGQ
jgi:hypothetical protein